jgi:uncharacterized membrane protein YkoI
MSGLFAQSCAGVSTLELSMFDRRIFLFVGLFTSSAHMASADDDHDDDDDHERARLALQRGEIRPLTEIMGRLQAELGGEVIEVEFKHRRRNRVFAYQFKVLTPRGRISEVLVDAATAKILERDDD